MLYKDGLDFWKMLLIFSGPPIPEIWELKP